MLIGRLAYHDEEFGTLNYSLKAVENYKETRISIENNIEEGRNKALAKMVMDRDINAETEEERYSYTPVSSDFRRLDIQKTNSVKTIIVNRLMASRIGALVRYMFMQDNKVDAGEDLFSYRGHDDGSEAVVDILETTKTVNVEGIGYIKYDKGLMTEIFARNKYVDIHLYTIEDGDYLEGQFKGLKQKDKWGNLLYTTPVVNISFKMDEKTLGFTYTSQVAEKPPTLFGVYSTLEEVQRAHPHKNIAWMNGRKYVIVTDEILEDVMKMFYETDSYIAFDTETTGLKITFRSRMGKDDQLVGVVLSQQIGTGYYFPLQHKQFKNLCNGDHMYFMKKYMRKLLETKKIVTHNLSFDWKVAHIYDIVVNCKFDTMIALSCTERYRDSTFSTGLKDVIKNLYGYDMLEIGDFLESGDLSNSDATFADLSYDLVQAYAPTDGDATLMLMDWIVRNRLLEKYQAERIFEEEITFAACVAYSEFYGYQVDTEQIPAMREEILNGMEKHKARMVEIAGQDFNPESPKQLVPIMYDKLGFPELNNKRSTDKDTLGEFLQYSTESGELRYPFAKELKDFRTYNGIYKNFLKKLHTFINPDGIIHPKVFAFGTDTGRASIREPNYQSYNDEVKRRIVARKGYYMFDCDFSQIEQRVLASMAEQESLIEGMNDPDTDYHTYQASRMFNIPYASVPKSLRSQSKGINFGLPYGMGDWSLGARIFGERTKANMEKAKELRVKFFEGQEKIQEFFERVRSEGVRNGYTSTYFGRRRFYNKAVFDEGAIRRQAGNHVIQGTAADIYKMSVNRMFKRVIKEGWLGYVLFNAFVHDELVMEVHKSINPYYFFKAWREEFQLEIDGFCNLYAGAGVGYSWYEAKKQDLPVQYIQEIIDTYHEDMEWDENFAEFIAWTNSNYEEYKNKRIIDFFTDSANDQQVISPIINSLLFEQVQKIINNVTGSNDTATLKEWNFNFGLGLQEGKTYKEKDLARLNFYGLSDLYCHVKGVEKPVKIYSPDDSDKALQTGETKKKPVEYVSLDMTNYDLAELAMYKGYHIDDEGSRLFLTDMNVVVNGQTISIIQYFVNQGWVGSQGIFQIGTVNIETKEVLHYNAYCNVESMKNICRTYDSLKQTTFTRW